MTKTEQYKTGVIGVIGLARIKNSEIGNYEEHFFNDSFKIVSRLTNGRIEMSVEVAQDYEHDPKSVTEERIQKVVDTFKKK
jgi:hypothetical protein